MVEVVHRQRACRSFSDDRVDDDTVEKVLDAATFAPSAENRQPWVFVVVRDPERRAAIGALTRQAWEGGGRAHSEGRLSPGLMADVETGAQGGVAGAPVLVIVCGDTRLGDRRVLEASVFPAIQNLLLTATALGLGSSLTTLPLVFGAELAAIVGAPGAGAPHGRHPSGLAGAAVVAASARPVFREDASRDLRHSVVSSAAPHTVPG